MSNYHGRRAPNVSQYLRELNTIQEAAAPSATATASEETFNSLEDDLAMFTNTQFFDFDSGQNTDYQSHPAKQDGETPRLDDPASAASTTTVDEFSSLNFMTSDFNFPDFGGAYTSPTLQNFSDNISNLQPIQPNPQSVYPAPQQQQSNGYHPPPPPRIGTGSGVGAAADKVRTPESSISVSPNRPLNFEEASRLAAEEDKRRRNTAASARFRIKKKQREQALEKSAKEMNEKVAALEGRISQLETENKWLKNLIMEKNDGNEDIAKLWKDFSTRQKAGLAGEAAKEAAKKPAPASPEEHEGGDMTG